jgi:hypothetical protein
MFLRLSCLLVLSAANCHSQPAEYVWPIDSPRIVSGNYGELRPNHFHAGIDFSSGNRENLKVFAVNRGYVSRIKVSAAGYGRAVYLTHPEGTVSVYAHLNAFNEKIDALVKQRQGEARNFEVDFAVRKDSIRVVKGEVIGLSGNTGGSSGPHLHFELRDEKTETPVNPLLVFKQRDVFPPLVDGLAFYDLSDTLNPRLLKTVKVKRLMGKLVPEIPKLVLTSGVIGVAFSGHDRFTARGAKTNVYRARVFLDEEIVYEHRLDRIAFSENRYVNEFSDPVKKKVYQKCFMPTLYPLRMYPFTGSKGRIIPADRDWHELKLVLNDERGNATAVRIKVSSTTEARFKAPPMAPGYAECALDFVMKQSDVRLYIPAGNLYRNAVISITYEDPLRFHVMPAVNLRGAAVISLPSREGMAPEKTVLRIDKTYHTSAVQRDTMFFYVKQFGAFDLLEDTVPPGLKRYIYKDRKKRPRKAEAIAFIVRDAMSGVDRYSITVNGRWVLAEYDAKNDMVFYKIDTDTPPGDLQVVVEVTDRAGNRNRAAITVPEADLIRRSIMKE